MHGPTHRPQAIAEVAELLAQANAAGTTLDIVAGGTQRFTGAAAADASLDVRGLSGITNYDADELVLTAAAGTPLCEIERVLDERQQMLAFEPYDHGWLAGSTLDRATLGGIMATNVAGSRRVSAGAARDHMLGFDGVSGRGEILKGGAAVVKNVTGFDLPKLMAGSWGTLAVLTSLTVRVLPKPRTQKSVVFEGLPDELANRLLVAAVASPAAVSGAVHVSGATTVLRVEGFGPSVDVRCRELQRSLQAFGTAQVIDEAQSAVFWAGMRRLSVIPVLGCDLWRVSVPPARGSQVRAQLETSAAAAGACYVYDWGGALVWIAVPVAVAAGAALELPCIAQALGGYARLIRPDAASCVQAGSPLTAATAGANLLQARVKAAFDPRRVLNPAFEFVRLT